MPSHRRLAVVVAAVAIALFGAACEDDPTTNAADPSSGSSSVSTPPQSTSPDKATFCSINAALNEGTKGVHTLDEFVVALRPFEARLDTFVALAPDAVKADAQALVDVAHAALNSNDGNAFLDPSLDTVGQHIADFCAP